MALESDAAAWWEIAARGLRTVLTTVPAGAVRAVGLCGLMHTLVPIDARGRPLDRPLLWPDQRARTALLALAPYQEQIVQIQGRPPTTLSCLAKLAWLRQHRPDVLARATAWLPPKDFLRFCLTGELATDARDAAGTMLTEAATGQWSEALLALRGRR
jgi:xylulokinase